MPLLQDQYSDTSRIAVLNIVIPLYSTTADISHNGLPEKNLLKRSRAAIVFTGFMDRMHMILCSPVVMYDLGRVPP